MSLSKIMSLVDANADKLPDGAYLEICNELKAVWKRHPPSRGAAAAAAAREAERLYESVYEFEEYLRHVEEAMEADQRYKEWLSDLENLEGEVPEKYHAICVNAYIAEDVPWDQKCHLNRVCRQNTRNVEGLRLAGVDIPDAEAFYAHWFPKLKNEFVEEVEGPMSGGGADYAWCEFSQTPGFEDALSLIQREQRAIEWRRRLEYGAFEETDGGVSGARVEFPMTFVKPVVEEQPDYR